MSGPAFYDLADNKSGGGLDVIFPGFYPARESVVFISPHDDDAALGAGYLLLASKLAGAKVHVIVMCDGRAGYTKPELKDSIVDMRRIETVKAYGKLGVPKSNIHPFEYPDFSLDSYIGFELPDGAEGAFGRIVGLLREIKATRLAIPNGWMEHPDHTAAHDIGAFHGPQAGDPIVPDRGRPSRIKSYLVYAVWGDLPPPDYGQPLPPGVRADLMLVAPKSFENKVAASLRCFGSQAGVIEGLLKARRQRVRGDRAIEVYRRLTPRHRLDYRPYWAALEKLSGKKRKR